jgi:hypothetical protein
MLNSQHVGSSDLPTLLPVPSKDPSELPYEVHKLMSTTNLLFEKLTKAKLLNMTTDAFIQNLERHR